MFKIYESLLNCFSSRRKMFVINEKGREFDLTERDSYGEAGIL